MNVIDHLFTECNQIALTSLAARIIVVSWDRSPHSARNVSVNAWMKILDINEKMLFAGLPDFLMTPDSGSCTSVVEASFSNCNNIHTSRAHLEVQTFCNFPQKHTFCVLTEVRFVTQYITCLQNAFKDSRVHFQPQNPMLEYS